MGKHRLTFLLTVGAMVALTDCRAAEAKAPEIVLDGSKPVEGKFNSAVDPYETLRGVEYVGTVPVRHSRDIADSPLSVGYETLDRKTFDPSWTFRYMGLAGVKRARCQTGWIRCEREKGKYDFSWLDEVVDGLSREGVSTWLSVSFGNPLYTPCETFERQIAEAQSKGVTVPGWARGYVGESPLMHGEEATRAYVAFVHALARHFKGRVREWEVWNEPEGFWCYKFGEIPLQKALDTYAEMVRITSQAIREEIPDAKVGFDLAWLSSEWIPGLARRGVADWIDMFMIHSYEPYPEAGFRETVEQVRTLFARKDGRPVDIWQGESGRSTGPAGNGLILPTEFSQARFLARRLANDVSEGAKVSSIFVVTDLLSYYQDGRDSLYGLLDGRTRKPKQAWRTLQAMGWLLDGLRRAPEHWIHFRTADEREFTDEIPYSSVKVAAFDRKGVPVYSFWRMQHVELNAAPLRGNVEVVSGRGGKPFEDPVLIDPVRCKVWDVKALMSEGWHGKPWLFTGLYSLDYPLFLTDRSVLGM